MYFTFFLPEGSRREEITTGSEGLFSGEHEQALVILMQYFHYIFIFLVYTWTFFTAVKPQEDMSCASICLFYAHFEVLHQKRLMERAKIL